MEILTLIIKNQYYQEILSGKKKKEFREINPFTPKKYCQVDKFGEALLVNGEYVPRHYDAIRFYVGYRKDRATALIEVKDINIEPMRDEQGHCIIIKMDDEVFKVMQVVYTLGEVLETN